MSSYDSKHSESIKRIQKDIEYVKNNEKLNSY